ncbi:hypothetical protein GGR22_001467 [Flavobacterium gossypii]|uniref:Uncharacterized protein n=3 Tax=Flavobacteriaceae TaxID=49546 RepID=A0A495MPU4_9FLAO|nr:MULTISPECIES: DUF6327 family protein [Flavobacterium]MBA9073341.1 hypothetical protein [Flavobacterium gossypii]RKS26369.1 hypothetical protein CLV94_1426 [Flavobacterium endophyticum]
MQVKNYSSYEEINRELQILKVEKDLAYEKMNKSFHETKDSFTAKNILGTVPGIALNIIGSLSGPLKNVGIAYLTKKIFRL